MDFFFFFFFFFHLLVVYLVGVRLLKFLISVEFIFLVIFLFFSLFTLKYENSYILLFLSLLACEASVGLSVLVSVFSYFDKVNVKSSVFVGW